jgi:SAM-dependent methyltransferase
VYVHGEGRLAADRQRLTASGGSEVYGSAGELLATNRADLQATRVDDPRAEGGLETSTSDPYSPTSDDDAPLEQVGSAVLFENDRVRVWEMTLDPGETCDLHRHRHDDLIIYPDDALGRSSSRSRLERVEAGLVAFARVGAEGLPPHQITNAGERRSTHYVVELLGRSAAATAQPLAHNGRVQVEHDPGRLPTREARQDATTKSASPTSTSSRTGVEAVGRADGDDPDLDALKQGARVVWAAGDYPAIARVIAEAGDATARRAGAASGVRLLDVACGDGNVAIPAARAGARVTALDLTPELLDAGRVRAATEGVNISWVQGDAEELPFGEASFDAVTSNFGAVFAPRHAVVASELARVCRPGGRIVITAWVPDGFNERVAQIAMAYLPQPPITDPPVRWADPAHARACFQSTDVELSFQRDSIRARVASVQAIVALMARSFGPLALARERLTQQGRWAQLLAAITAECDRWAKPVADGIQIDMDYVAITGQRHTKQPTSEQT